MGRHDVVITGLGVISPIGLDVAELLASLRSNRSGIGLWQSPGKNLPAGLIARDFATEFTKLELPYLDRCTQMALLAARQAAADAGLEQFADYGTRAGLYYGSVCGGVRTEHDWVKQFFMEGKQLARPYTIMASMLNAAPAHISIHHQILGPVMTHSSACTSSGAAIGDASRAIRDGYLDVALVGGAESSLTPTFMALWGGLRALAEPDPADVSRSCRPFSSRRNGLVLGEGAVFLMIESREHAQRRGARCYAALSGYGIASDGYHIGSPKLEGQVATLRSALADAGLAAGQVGYVNAHATGTAGGDPIEADAITRVLGNVPVSSTKAIHGHLLGAASAMELAITVLAVNQAFLPATANLDEVDPACALKHVANTPVFGHPVDHALSFSAGFGGTNVALIVSREEKLPLKAPA
ncbi:MAG TPA: beta-ketoacyl-[acyl-carrier-protein] synthase family protein [Rudaea sp.]|nr:beta-ketoacyl-[acyl-carrier-protein] synthase family protein [Rudaea sp.]